MTEDMSELRKTAFIEITQPHSAQQTNSFDVFRGISFGVPAVLGCAETTKADTVKHTPLDQNLFRQHSSLQIIEMLKFKGEFTV